MSSTLSIEELRAKSAQANELIEKLKHQIEQIKLASTPASMAERAKNLQKENEVLKKKVEELKKELENAESKNPLGNVTNIKVPTPTSTPTPEAPKPVAKAAVAPEPSKKTEKKAKQEKQPQQPKKAELNPEDINVSSLDIRIGKIMKCERHPDADGLYVEQIDLGEGKLRNVCSGLVKHIPLEEMQDRMVVLLCNLKPCKLRGVLSEAMVLCASTPEKVELMIPPPGAQIGDRVTAEGFSGEPVAECTPKNKVFDIVAADLKTNDSMVGTYKGVTLEVKGKGPLKSATLKNVMIK